MDEALDATKEVINLTAANTVTPAAAKSPKRVSSLISLFGKSSAVHQTPEAKVTRNITSMEKHVELSNPPKLRQNMFKVVDPPWYKPVVSAVLSMEVTSKLSSCISMDTTTSISELLGQA